MKSFISVVAALVLVTVVAQAQDPTIHPIPVAGATLVAEIPMSTTVSIEVLGKVKSDKVSNHLFVWRTATGQTQFSLGTSSMTPEIGLEIDYIPTKEIFRQVSANAVAVGAQMGFLPPAGTQQTKVWYESSVERTGSGLATRFAACPSYTMVARDYAVTFVDGQAMVTDLSTTSYPNGCGAPSSTIQ
jgi:hypothetical protein